MENNEVVNIKGLRKATFIFMIVGLVFYLVTLLLIIGAEGRVPPRFLEKRLPKNLFLYINLGSLVLFLLLLPAFINLYKIYISLGDSHEVNLTDILVKFKKLFWSLILPWIFYSTILLVVAVKYGIF